MSILTKQKLIKIGLVACESSGDILGAGLIRSLRRHLSKVHFIGIAGPRMQLEGMESWYNIEDLEVMGLLEVFKHIWKLLSIRRDLIYRFIEINLDIFIGIDAPDFTLTLEKHLKKHGICTIHYVSPSIWAWRKNRIFKIRQATNNVLSLFPFEKSFYDKYNIPCQFIGHRLADKIPLDPYKNIARQELGISVDTCCLILLPGSRQMEVAMLSADFLQAAEKISQIFSKIEIIVPLVNKNRRAQFESIRKKVTPLLSVRLLSSQVAHQAMIASDAAIVASGTAALECMLAKCPMVVGYRMNPITFALAKRLVKIPWISLPNILAGKEIVKELIQEKCNPNIIASTIVNLLSDNELRTKLITIFRQLHKQIRCNADEQAAQAVLQLINRK